MSREKRPANDAFGSSQLVKRAKPDATDSTALTVANGTAQNGALIQAVRHPAQLLPQSPQQTLCCADSCNRCRELLRCSRPSWS
jgi:Prp8 binding protein